MKAKVKIETSIDAKDIIVYRGLENLTLEGLLRIIDINLTQVLIDISTQKQSINPEWDDIDAPIHKLLNLIESITYE